MEKLGRGLDVLLNQSKKINISGEQLTASKEQITDMDINRLKRGQFQPRGSINPQAVEDLVDSIQVQGILQPIIVRKLGKNYEVIAGERRFQAAKIAKLKKVPVIIRSLSDQQSLAIALIENIQRESLTSLEQARALERLTSEFSMTHQQVANVVSRSRVSVTNLIRLLQLDSRVQQLLNNNYIEMGHARALLSLDNNEQFKVANYVVDKHWSVRQTENYIRRLKQPKMTETNVNILQTNQVIATSILQLSQRLGSRVNLKNNKNSERGKLLINYKSSKHLEELLAKILL